jgi:hypothetical protein
MVSTQSRMHDIGGNTATMHFMTETPRENLLPLTRQLTHLQGSLPLLASSSRPNSPLATTICSTIYADAKHATRAHTCSRVGQQSELGASAQL